LQVLCTSSTTTDMIAFTDRRVYVLYPPFALRNSYIQRPAPIARQGHHFDGGPQNVGETWPLTRCGKFCSALWRKARPGEGIATFFWNGREEKRCIEEGKMKHPYHCGYGPHRGKPCLAVMRVLDRGSLFEDICRFKWRLGECKCGGSS
jgi:hypothetical protein